MLQKHENKRFYEHSMRGQTLFIRPFESSDRDAVQAFLTAENRTSEIGDFGLLGKLVGDLVAVLLLELTPDSVKVTELVVTKDLRRKQIGRFMLAEAASLAKKLDRSRLVAEAASGTADFLRRSGFHDDDHGRMVRLLE